MRLFIAIDFMELSNYFAELQKHIPAGAKLSFAKAFHLTLKFLGEVNPQDAEKTVDILKKIKFEPFAVFLDSIGIFPTENYIRIIWLGLRPEDKILELQSKIDESLKTLFKKDKEFKPHITLARVKYPENKKSFLEGLRKINVENRRMDIRNFRLVKSTLNPKGTVYEDLAIFEAKS